MKMSSFRGRLSASLSATDLKTNLFSQSILKLGIVVVNEQSHSLPKKHPSPFFRNSTH